MFSTMRRGYDGVFVLRWAFATGIGSATGVALGWGLAVFFFPTANPLALRNAVMIIPWGVFVGLAQGLVIRGRLPRARWWVASWVAGCVLFTVLSDFGIAALAWAVSAGPLHDLFAGLGQVRATKLWYTILLVTFALIGLLVYLGIFGVQWLTLRANVQHAWVWLVATVATAAITLAAETLFYTSSVAADLVHPRGFTTPGDWSALWTGTPIALASGLLYGVLTGAVLAWLFTRPVVRGG